MIVKTVEKVQHKAGSIILIEPKYFRTICEIVPARIIG